MLKTWRADIVVTNSPSPTERGVESGFFPVGRHGCQPEQEAGVHPRRGLGREEGLQWDRAGRLTVDQHRVPHDPEPEVVKPWNPFRVQADLVVSSVI